MPNDCWNKNNLINLQESYTKYSEPWRQSGFSGHEERWINLRKPIANFIDKSGSFLDIGCANGYLLQCIMSWAAAKGFNIVPFGVDVGDKLISLAKLRLEYYKDNFYIGDMVNWQSPCKYDFIRTEIIYVEEALRKEFLTRILKTMLKEDGKLLVCEYRPSKIEINEPWVDNAITGYGFKILDVKSAYENEKELTRVLEVAL